MIAALAWLMERALLASSYVCGPDDVEDITSVTLRPWDDYRGFDIDVERRPFKSALFLGDFR